MRNVLLIKGLIYVVLPCSVVWRGGGGGAGPISPGPGSSLHCHTAASTCTPAQHGKLRLSRPSSVLQPPTVALSHCHTLLWPCHTLTLSRCHALMWRIYTVYHLQGYPIVPALVLKKLPLVIWHDFIHLQSPKVLDRCLLSRLQPTTEGSRPNSSNL